MPSFYLLLYIIIYFACSLFHFLLLNIGRSLLITGELVGEVSASTGHRTKSSGISVELHGRNISFDDLISLVIRVHTQHTTATFVQITHHITGIFIRNDDFQGRDRLKEYREASMKPFLKAMIAAVLKAISEESTG